MTLPHLSNGGVANVTVLPNRGRKASREPTGLTGSMVLTGLTALRGRKVNLAKMGRMGKMVSLALRASRDRLARTELMD